MERRISEFVVQGPPKFRTEVIITERGKMTVTVEVGNMGLYNTTAHVARGAPVKLGDVALQPAGESGGSLAQELFHATTPPPDQQPSA